MTPKLVIKPMKEWQSRILNFIGYLVGLRNGSCAWISIEDLIFTAEYEATINDLKRMHEEDAMNRVRQQTTNRMESGE